MATIGPASDPRVTRFDESQGQNNLSDTAKGEILHSGDPSADTSVRNTPQSVTAVFQDSFRDSIEQATTAPLTPEDSNVFSTAKVDPRLESLFSRQKLEPEQRTKITEFISAFRKKNGEFYTELA